MSYSAGIIVDNQPRRRLQVCQAMACLNMGEVIKTIWVAVEKEVSSRQKQWNGLDII
jgi:NADH:ubiquinone oxidoreductase subunit E